MSIAAAPACGRINEVVVYFLRLGLALVEPPAPNDEFLPEVAYVGDRAAKGAHAQLREGQ